MSTNLVEVDSLTALVIIDNELDIFSPVAAGTVTAEGNIFKIAEGGPHIHGRGEIEKELRMDHICCGAWGLSVLLTATKDGVSHSMLFDAGPEEEAWARNLSRLAADVSPVEVVQLSHWHRDHSGGLLEAIRTIKSHKAVSSQSISQDLLVDLHPNRPDFRGFKAENGTFSMEADPTFKEIEEAGGIVQKHSVPHTVCENFFLLSGEIPRVTPYEVGLKNGVRYSLESKEWTKDEEIGDERALVVNLKGRGLVVLTGCAHAGVVNTVKCARGLVPGAPLHAVMGGFHLSSSGMEQVEAAVGELKGMEVKILVPGHCTGWRAKFEIERAMPGRLVPSVAGMSYTF